MFNPVRVEFGSGVRGLLVSALAKEQSFALVCTKSGRERIQGDPGFRELMAQPRLIWFDEVGRNPDITSLQRLIDGLRSLRPEAVVAVGGGSVMDSAKAAAVAIGDNSPDVLARLINSPDALLASVKPLPVHMCPTTAGTGSEVTPFATIWDWDNRKKMSLAGPVLFPTTAFVDPELTWMVPEDVTITTGLDAVNQALESIWNRNATPGTLPLSMEALALGLEALPRLATNLADHTARADIMRCSLLAGLAISHTRTALCHSISYPLTCHFGVPHGLACAFTMLSVFRLNRRHDDRRFTSAAAFLKLRDVDALEMRIRTLVEGLRVAERVHAFLPSLAAVKKLAPDMITIGRADNNLAPVDESVVLDILDSSAILSP